MSTVFISYRRETSSGEARALFNDLVARLGRDSVFMDVDSIALGRDFRSILQKTLGSCDLMLVIIDKDWVGVKDEAGRIRLGNPGDYVRMEIEGALKRDIAVTPVLVKGAHMPTAEELPEEITELVYRNGFELTFNRWDSDVREMIRRLGLEPPEGGRQIEMDQQPIAPGNATGRSVPIGQATSKQRHSEQVASGGHNPQATPTVDENPAPMKRWLQTVPGMLTAASVSVAALVIIIAALTPLGGGISGFFQPKEVYNLERCSARSGYPIGQWNVDNILSPTPRGDFSNFILFTNPKGGTWPASGGRQGSFTSSKALSPNAEIILTMTLDQTTYVSTNTLVVSADGCRMLGKFEDNDTVKHSGVVAYVFAGDQEPSRK